MQSDPYRELLAHPGLLWTMTARDFRSKYVGSLMGAFWTIVNPLLLLLVFTFIFAVVFKARFGGRPELGVSALYILCGILPWLAFQEALARAGTVVLENKNLVTRARFPLSVLLTFPAVSALLGQFMGMLVLGLISSVTLPGPSDSMIILPVIVLLQLVFTVGLSMIIGSVSVYLRDLIHVLPVLLLVWMYGTPIFYPAELVPGGFRVLIYLNPFTHFVESYRAVLLEGLWPDWTSLAAMVFCAVLSAMAGARVMARLAPGFADRL